MIHRRPFPVARWATTHDAPSWLRRTNAPAARRLARWGEAKQEGAIKLRRAVCRDCVRWAERAVVVVEVSSRSKCSRGVARGTKRRRNNRRERWRNRDTKARAAGAGAAVMREKALPVVAAAPPSTSRQARLAAQGPAQQCAGLAQESRPAPPPISQTRDRDADKDTPEQTRWLTRDAGDCCCSRSSGRVSRRWR